MKVVSPKGSGWEKFLGQLGTVLLIFILLLFLFNSYQNFAGLSKEPEEVSITELADEISNGLVKEVVVDGNDIDIILNDPNETKQVSRKGSDADLTEILANLGVTPGEFRGTSIVEKKPSGFSVWFLPLLSIFAPILFLIFIFWILTRQVKGSTMQAFTFGQSKARIIDPDDKNQRVTFKDVAGSEESKEELKEIVDFLKNPQKFIEIGARIPKGVLLMGPPGTGKTLLARAVAGEANVPFFYLSGSEFVEMFVGVGASRVRDLFKMAKKSAPAIIFIDEIDAVGRHRGGGLGGGHDEREQTLNQILVEMDGFEPNEKVIVLSATNRPDVLDPALLRPGRFDRRVLIDLPDIKEREAILNVHSRKKSLGEDVNLHVIAQRTPGFSGADLANLMNEGAILAAREERNKVTQYDLIRSVEKVMLGPERRSRIITEKEKKITAYHEGGHALTASILPYADPVHKVTIVSRGHAGGYTLKLPLEEKRLQSKKEFLDDIAVALSGYAAEELIFDDLTTGASNDIAVATALARDMVTRYGMSEHIGPIAFREGESSIYRDGRVILGEKSFSEDVISQVDKEVSKIMKDAKKLATETLSRNIKVLHAVADELMKVETLEQENFEKLLVLHGIKPKKKEDVISELSAASDAEMK
jgi:cell division protease FtsH